jgi:F-type H+-transporting ATPase subunit b
MLDNKLILFASSESSESAEGFAALGFDPKAFLIQLITFLIVFYILKKYVFGRVVDMLEKRRETIEEGVRLSAQAAEEKEKLDREVEATRAKARKEADEIISRTQEQTSVMIKEAETAATEKANALIEEARKKIEEETARARRKLEAEVVELVIEATEVVASEKLDAKKDAALLSRALKGQAQ